MSRSCMSHPIFVYKIWKPIFKDDICGCTMRSLSLSTAFESKQTLEFTWSFNVGYEDFKIWQTNIISLHHHSVRLSCKPGLQAYFWNMQASCISDTLQSCQFLTQTLVSASKIVSQRCPNFPPPFHCESGFPILIEWVSDHPTDQPLQRQRRFSAPTPLTPNQTRSDCELPRHDLNLPPKFKKYMYLKMCTFLGSFVCHQMLLTF